MKRKIAFHTLGCKVNIYETEAMMEQMKEAGYEIVGFEDRADIYVVNTCSVTNIADKKSGQMLRKARKQNGDSIIVAAGCYVQAKAEELIKSLDVDIIIGNNLKKDIAAIIENYINRENGTQSDAAQVKNGTQSDAAQVKNGMQSADAVQSNAMRHDNGSQGNAPQIENVVQSNDGIRSEVKSAQFHVLDIGKESAFEEFGQVANADHTRAFVKIQDGCNQFCSYCIIPFTRGRVRSRRLGDIIREVKALADKGYQEFVLTGIHISSYGVDFKSRSDFETGIAMDYNENDSLLADLIENIAKIDNVQRIRLSSLEPRVVTEDFLRRMSQIPAFCPHFHLSLQSGCDATLKRMNRKYDSALFEEKAKSIRHYFPNAALTTDIIVGFPGEDDAEFEESFCFAKRMRFAEMHVFPYSKREGTRATAMKGEPDKHTKQLRAARMMDMARQAKKEFMQSFSGSEAEALLEKSLITVDGQSYRTGYTKEYLKIGVLAGETKPNQILRGRISGVLMEDVMLLVMDL